MSADIKRDTELYLMHALQAALPNYKIYPMHGGDEETPAAEIEPPFVVVAVGDANKRVQRSDVYMAVGTVQVISMIQDSTSQDYATMVSNVHHALVNIPPGATDEFRLHGIDIRDHRSATDETQHAYADLIDFQAGVSGG
jgi:hypothetical protein